MTKIVNLKCRNSLYRLHPRISIRGCVCPYVCLLVRRSVMLSVTLSWKMTKIENFKCRNSQYRLHPCISIRGYAQKFLRTHRWPLGLVYLIFIEFGLGAKWVVLNHFGDFWMSFWTAQAFQLLLPTSNWQQSSSSSKLYDFFPVGESRLLWYSSFPAENLSLPAKYRSVPALSDISASTS